jgi:hypothetical protein
MKKKGFIGDLLSYIIVLFLLAIVIVVIYYALTQINSAWQGNTGIQSQPKQMLSDYKNSFVGTFDFFYLFLVVGYFIIIIITAYYLRSHPMFAFLAIIIMVVFGIVATHFSNAFFDVSSTAAFSASAGEFTFLSFFGLRLPHLVIILGVIFIIIMFAKSQNQGATL